MQTLPFTGGPKSEAAEEFLKQFKLAASDIYFGPHYLRQVRWYLRDRETPVRNSDRKTLRS